jgi:hypothetical protein
MHGIVENELEKHLGGDASKAFYEHLERCPGCRSEVSEMDEVAALLREMKASPGDVPQPRLGFYNRVVGDIVEQQRAEAWGLFSPGAAFFRRVAFASLLVLASLGSFLVTRESSEGGVDAASIMAEHSGSGTLAADVSASDRDRILVTLASYRE